jgi:hypothetical protein
VRSRASLRYQRVCYGLAVRSKSFLASETWRCSAWPGRCGFAIAGGAGLHLYNRVVTQQGLLNARGPATAMFLSRMGTLPLQDVAHWDVSPVLERQGLSYSEARSLMGAVAMEGLRSDPSGFLRYSTM